MIQGVLRERTEAHLAAFSRILELKYTGGTPFFDALDAGLRSPDWYWPLLLRYMDEFPTRPKPIVSGQFGISFASWLADSDYSKYVKPAIWMPGDLRHKTLPKLNADFTGYEMAFLDDSYYKGRTYHQIKSRVEEAGGRVVGGLVLYDGSPNPPELPSFYRYHSDIR